MPAFSLCGVGNESRRGAANGACSDDALNATGLRNAEASYMPLALPRDEPLVPCIVSPEPSRPGGLVIPSVVDGVPVRPGTLLVDPAWSVDPARVRPAVLPFPPDESGAVRGVDAPELLDGPARSADEALACADAGAAMRISTAAAAPRCLPAFIVIFSQWLDMRVQHVPCPVREPANVSEKYGRLAR